MQQITSNMPLLTRTVVDDIPRNFFYIKNSSLVMMEGPSTILWILQHQTSYKSESGKFCSPCSRYELHCIGSTHTMVAKRLNLSGIGGHADANNFFTFSDWFLMHVLAFEALSHFPPLEGDKLLRISSKAHEDTISGTVVCQCGHFPVTRVVWTQGQKRSTDDFTRGPSLLASKLLVFPNKLDYNEERIFMM
ncbi:unnamed protein product [Clavelina lepadiformis]|uniref:Uncharacterized protein n=1 Tax=Clavelina lepadiformis TaxID=159417 RepID=A0ABP0GDK9_CLALP